MPNTLRRLTSRVKRRLQGWAIFAAGILSLFILAYKYVVLLPLEVIKLGVKPIFGSLKQRIRARLELIKPALTAKRRSK